MIAADVREYEYFLIDGKDSYGQDTYNTDEASGTVKMAIYTTNQSIDNSILYSGAQYIGLTKQNIDDSYIVKYDNQLLKVLYVHPRGRMKQAYMTKI